MNVLVLGSGGREHAIAWRLARDTRLEQLYIAPGNAGSLKIGQNVALDINDFDQVAEFCSIYSVDLVVVGPEDPLVNGITDFLNKKLPELLVFGPGQEGAALEGSKDIAKEFMGRHKIPTALHQSFKRSELIQAKAFLEMLESPYVIKADGLAAGKGVIITETLEEAAATLDEMLGEGKFGAASDKVLIEEFLSGIEMSVFVVTDGKNYAYLPSAKDYKRIGEGDTGPNTGGMGTISPVPFADEAFMQIVDETIVKPTVDGLAADGINYRGFIFIGLMVSDGIPYVIEYNVRLGDPETESILPRVEGDFLSLLESAAKGNIDSNLISVSDSWSATVMMVSGGYPGSYEKGKEITGLDTPFPDGEVFHAGTKAIEEKVISNGGRVLGINGRGPSMKEALASAYAMAEKINFEGVNYRRDLGRDLEPYIS